ncbi:hypothetical protein BCT73_06580 [Vibrio breoganii]|uniref:glycosyltransferase family 2 protein n=1 Tax=Vibrio breoganii TaxID=553239 RepID=UPI000C866F17|nr:glycosyltransferase family 2 protein [Vibrio breoganii]PML61251.1 hypothetical protein BCT73_06580 [Vibrio breoganii]
MKVNKVDVTVLVLTYNEEIHIERCIQSLKPFAQRIIIVDSYSTDRTVDLSKNLGAEVIQNKWPNNHSKQVNWALGNIIITSEWVMRVDADEYITQELGKEIAVNLRTPGDYSGYYLLRGHVFMGKKILWGGSAKTKMLRIWRTGSAKCEDKIMDEHMIMNDPQSKIGIFKSRFWDHNLNSLSWWTEKHNSYSTKEALMQMKLEASNEDFSSLNQYLKSHVYQSFPVWARSFIFFLYRYIFRLGFLDGFPGLAWHVLQGFWYRFLVDCKVRELKYNKPENVTIERWVEQRIEDIEKGDIK